MPLYNKTLLHIHIPKTGGTSITQTLKDQGVSVEYFDKANAEQYGGVPPQHMTIEYTKKFFDLKDTSAFAVVRNPWHRTVSEYVWRTKSDNFLDLNSWIKEVLTNINHQEYANHLVPQHRFYNDDVKIFRYDKWNNICNFIANKLDINLEITTRKQQRLEYKPPMISVLDKDVRSLWESFYSIDLESFDSL